MIISIVVAMSSNRAIGLNNQLPWNLPADLKHFKDVTMGKPIIMGRKTHESIGRALPGRKNIIVTRDQNYQAKDCVVAHNIEDALQAASDVEEVAIIGGENIFKQTMDKVNRIYLTVIHEDIDGDTFFPELGEEWHEVERKDCTPDEKNQYHYSFLILERST